MPTGYTDIFEKQPNVSFRDFAIRCADSLDEAKAAAERAAGVRS